MKGIGILLMTLIMFGGLVSARIMAAEDILFRTEVTPEEPWVGEQVLLSVDVLAKDGWAQLKKIGNTELDGAYLLRLETQGTRLNESIDGDTYTGQRYEFMIFPQRAGRFAILPIAVDVEVKSWGVGRNTQLHRLSLPLIEFTARTPPGAQGIRGLISTAKLTANQTWSPEIDSATVGDAIERTITLRAEDVSGMAFTPLRHNQIAQVGIYPGEPTVEDTFNRGDLDGTRVETVTYVFEGSGDVEIPGVEFSWWDVRLSELKRIELPGLSLRIAARAGMGSAVGQTTRQLNTRVLWAALVAVLVAVFAAFRFGGLALDRLAARRKARSEREAVYFKHVMRSVRSGDQKAVLRDTMRWLDRINVDSQAARLDQFLRQYGDTVVQVAAMDLVKTLTLVRNPSATITFGRGLASARRRWQKAQRVERQAECLLPHLNAAILKKSACGSA